MGKEKQEACQLYIEQEIDSGLKEDKTPYQIGKSVAKWVEKLFEVKLKPKSLMERARRQKLSTNVDTTITLKDNSEKEENQSKIHGCRLSARLLDGTVSRFHSPRPVRGRPSLQTS